jgi:molecular chaperone DnaK
MQAASAKMYQQAGAGQPGAGAGQQQYQGGQQAHSNPNDDVQDADFEEVK